MKQCLIVRVVSKTSLGQVEWCCMLMGGIDRSRRSEAVFDREGCFKDKSRMSRVVLSVDGWYQQV